MCTTRTRRRVAPRLGWSQLYGLALMTVALGLIVDATSGAGTVHRFLPGLVVISGFAGMLLWVRSNRVALSMAETCDCAAEDLRIRVVESRQSTPTRPAWELETPALVEASR